MRRASRPVVAPGNHAGGHRFPVRDVSQDYPVDQTLSEEFYDDSAYPHTYHNWDASPQNEFYDNWGVLSSPTPLPRQSSRFAAPRMLDSEEAPNVAHPNTYHDGFLDGFHDSYGYDHVAAESNVYDSDRGMGIDAYMGPGRAVTLDNAFSHERPTQTGSTRLVPVSVLPDRCRGMFKFGCFNAMQSRCFETAMNTNSNMVISAPTGAGKTVLFELAVIKLLLLNDSLSDRKQKCVYMAPTKAICSERYRDWSEKFSHIGAKCVELTGDTMATGRQAWRQAKDCAVIITTPEKWDSLTRNWNESSSFLQHVRLLMVDEVHTISETTRGSCLEVVVSRMMQRGNGVRFVLLSATAPNIEDLKDWLCSCSSGEPTVMLKFGDEFRPCKLQRYVYGFSRPRGHNDFQFMKALDHKLFPIVQRHSSGKPMLVFCPTRKGVMATATHLAEECQKTLRAGYDLPWRVPDRVDVQLSNPELQSLADLGLGVHHAGLSRDDRQAVEQLFTERKLSVVVATSTLAVGVNFPAHAVIVKGVMQWAGEGWAEYSSRDIMQMLGRAGRPQFDKEGVAIIMCEKHLETKYNLLSTGGSHLESTLHHNLAEHINSEIGLGTIDSVEAAKQWLRKTFFFRRVQKNPSHYNVAVDALGEASWEGCIDALVTHSLSVLQETQLIRAKANGSKLTLTDFGEIMSYYIRQPTMKRFIDVVNSQESCLRSLLRTISQAEEFKDIIMRAGERQIYQRLSEHESVRFPIKKPETSIDKILLLIQACLGGTPLMSNEFKSLNSQPHMEALGLVRHVPRMVAALVDIALVAQNGGVIANGTVLMRSVNSNAWEDRPVVLRQFEGIGEKSFKILAESGIATIESLSAEDPGRIELLLNRRPPFGSDLISVARSLPVYSISIEEIHTNVNHKTSTIDVTLSITVSAKTRSGKPRPLSKNLDTQESSILTVLSDNQYVDFRKISTKALSEAVKFSVTASLTKPSQTVIVIAAPVKCAGIVKRFYFQPSLPAHAYPTLDTRPLKESEYRDALPEQDTPDGVIDLTGSDQGQKMKVLKSKRQTHQGVNSPTLSKLRLSNGNFACLHKCKDKTACRHICQDLVCSCREGLPKPPASPKKAKPTEPSSLSSPIRPSQNTRGPPEKHKVLLDQVNDTTNTGASEIKRGPLARREGPLLTSGTGGRCSNGSTNNQNGSMALKDDVSSSSDTKLPEPSKKLFRSATPSDSLDSYDNSEMDAWAAKIPSEVLNVEEDGPDFAPAPGNPCPLEQRSKPVTKSSRQGTKRPIDLVEKPDFVEHAPKRPKSTVAAPEEIIDLETPPGEILDHPLEGDRAVSDYRDASIEEFLDDIFEGVQIIPEDAPNDTGSRSPNISIPKISLPSRQSTPSHNKTMPPAFVEAEEQNKKSSAEGGDSDDPMAQLNAWLDENGL